MTTKHAKILILGSGPAGYTAAIYAARAMLEPVVIQGSQPGGQMTVTTDVENYPGFAEVIQGPWLMEQMRAQAEHVGTETIMDLVVEVDLAAKPMRLEGTRAMSTPAMPSSLPPERRHAGWACLPRRGSRATGYPHAPPAMASSTRASAWR